MSRTSGVAPLAIFADAEQLSPQLTQRDFLNSHISIDFDADGADPSGEDRYAKGFLAGHVYTRPGTYRITTTVVDSEGQSAVAPPVTITVYDPEARFMPPMGETYCFSTPSGGGFTGCPTTDPARRIVTSNFQQALQYGGANRRLLFRRGDTWNSNGAWVAPAGPQLIAAFPAPLSTTGDRPRIVSNGGDWSSVLGMDNSSDVRVADLQLVGSFAGSSTDPRIGGITAGASQNALIYNTLLERLNHIGVYTGYGTTALTIAKTTIRDSGHYGIYGGAERLSIQRNKIANLKFQMHGIRIQGGSRSAISGNEITDIESFTAITMRGDNDRMVISDNLVEQIVTFSPQNNESNEHVSNVLFDGNLSQPGNGATTMGTAVNCTARVVVIRNNVWLNAGLGVGMGDHPLVGACQDVDIYNNTFFNSTNIFQHEHHLIYTGTGVQRLSLFNNIYFSMSSTNYGSAVNFNAPLSQLISGANIYHAPNQGPGWLQFAVPGATYSLVSFQALGKEVGSANQSPLFASTDPTSPLFLRLSSGSPAVDTGIPVTNRLDKAGTPRPRDGDGNGTLVIDRGAYER